MRSRGTDILQAPLQGGPMTSRTAHDNPQQYPKHPFWRACFDIHGTGNPEFMTRTVEYMTHCCRVNSETTHHTKDICMKLDRYNLKHGIAGAAAPYRGETATAAAPASASATSAGSRSATPYARPRPSA